MIEEGSAEISTPIATPGGVPLRVLVARPDRVGDVVLSTPVFEVLKRHNPKVHLTVLVRAPVVPLLEGLPFVDEVMVFDPDGRHAGLGGLFTLIREIRERKFRVGIALFSHWKIAAALFAAGVRYRVGPLSKIHSFFFYNRGVRQHRSYVEMHEVDYNLQLLRRLGIRVGSRNVPVRVSLDAEKKKKAREWLAERGWASDHEAPLVAVHPGMGGSALNWPENHYIELIRALMADKNRVVVTGGPEEGPLMGRIKAELGDKAQDVLFYGGAEVGGIGDLVGLFSHASVVVAPSTGPLHIAVALGKPVVTFYPPIRVQSALRWGPYVREEARASVLVPEMYCGQDFKCIGNLCNYYPCMRSLVVPQALEQVRKQLARSKEPQVIS